MRFLTDVKKEDEVKGFRGAEGEGSSSSSIKRALKVSPSSSSVSSSVSPSISATYCLYVVLNR